MPFGRCSWPQGAGDASASGSAVLVSDPIILRAICSKLGYMMLAHC
jgi:hypothetical protein